MTSAPIVMDFLGEQLTDVETASSVGTFGAVTEFTRDADEMATLARAHGMISASGALDLTFASRTRGWAGSECQIRSTSLLSSLPITDPGKVC